MALQNHRIYTSRHNYTAIYLDWSEEWISGGAENYSNISWRVGAHASGATATWYSNALKIISSNLGGNGLTTGTWSNITIPNGASVQLGNGSFNYGHDSAGNASIGGSIQGWLYGYGNTSTASGSWGLTWIPRYATINGYSGSITDEATNVYVNYSNPAGGAVTFALYVRPLGSSGGFTQVLNATNYASGGNQAANVDWNSLRTALSGAPTNKYNILYDRRFSLDIDFKDEIYFSIYKKFYRNHIKYLGTDASISSQGPGSLDRKSTRLNSSHRSLSRMPSSA